MKNCCNCNKKISKKYTYAYLAKTKEVPSICKTCKKVEDVTSGVRKERPCDLDKIRYFETHNIKRSSTVGILEKFSQNP